MFLTESAPASIWCQERHSEPPRVDQWLGEQAPIAVKYRPEPTASLARMVLCRNDPFLIIVSSSEETMKLNDIDIAKQTAFYLKNGYH